MTTPLDDAWAERLALWLTDRFGMAEPVVENLRRPTSGYSSETVFFDATWLDDGGGHSWYGVIRMAPPEQGTFQGFDLAAQWQAQTAAASGGIPTADPVLETDPSWLGAPFVAMRRVDGHVVGAVVHHDRWLGGLEPEAQAQVFRNFIVALSGIHGSVTTSATGVPRRDNGAELDFWEEYLDWSSAGHPVATLTRAITWCRRNQPATEPPPALLWGDARFENVVFGDDLTLQAVLDWDMTTIGAPEHDLAWFTSLDLTMSRLFGRRLPGAPDRAAIVRLFEAASGRAVRDLEWYETLAMVRSSAVMTRIGYLRRDAGEPPMLPIDDNPVLDILAERLN